MRFSFRRSQSGDEQADRHSTIGVDAFPALYRAADHKAITSQSRYLLFLRFRLGLLVLAAGFAVPATSVHNKGLAIASAVAFAIAGVVEGYLLKTHPEHVWYQARAAAESMKTLAWRYMVGGSPLGVASDDPDGLMIKRLQEIVHDMKDVALVAPNSSHTQITSQMRGFRSQELSARQALYMEERIQNQITWYSTKSQDATKRSNFWSIGLMVCEAVAAVAGALRAGGATQINLAGVAAAVTAGVIAWIQARDYSNLGAAYSVAANELSIIHIRGEAALESEDEWSEYVAECEEAISREHTLWRASHSHVSSR